MYTWLVGILTNKRCHGLGLQSITLPFRIALGRVQLSPDNTLLWISDGEGLYTVGCHQDIPVELRPDYLKPQQSRTSPRKSGHRSNCMYAKRNRTFSKLELYNIYIILYIYINQNVMHVSFVWVSVCVCNEHQSFLRIDYIQWRTKLSVSTWVRASSPCPH